jgi:site-specific recombinase XerD
MRKGGRRSFPFIASSLPERCARSYGRPVVVGVQGNRLHYTQLGQTFRHYVDASGINERKRVTPHTLRQSSPLMLLRAGANLHQIQELLGHKHLDSTQRYTRDNAHELRGAIKRLRWVGRR